MVDGPQLDGNLSGVAAVSSTDVWAVGNSRDGDSYQTLIEHWDGSVWRVVSSPNANPDISYLWGVAAVSGSDIWAVGDYFTDGTAQTLIESYNSCQGEPDPTATPAPGATATATAGANPYPNHGFMQGTTGRGGRPRR